MPQTPARRARKTSIGRKRQKTGKGRERNYAPRREYSSTGTSCQRLLRDSFRFGLARPISRLPREAYHRWELFKPAHDLARWVYHLTRTAGELVSEPDPPQAPYCTIASSRTRSRKCRLRSSGVRRSTSRPSMRDSSFSIRTIPKGVGVWLLSNATSYIHVAFRAEIIAKHRPETGEATDVVPPSEFSNAFLIDLHRKFHGS